MSSSEKPDRKPNSADWTEWRYAGNVRTSQAVHLSMDVDPNRGSNYDEDEALEFDKRVRMTARACADGRLSRPWIVRGSPWSSGVNLREFASWAVSVHWTGLPPEFVELASTGPNAATAVTTDGTSRKPPALAARPDRDDFSLSAPAPVYGNTLEGTVSSGEKPDRKPNSADWTEWRYAGTVKTWEAIQLSMGVDPNRGSHFEHDESQEFEKRLRMTVRACSDGRLSRLWIVRGRPLMSGVNLREFASWAVSVHWTGLPPEFVELASTGQNAATTVTTDGTSHKPPVLAAGTELDDLELPADIRRLALPSDRRPASAPSLPDGEWSRDDKDRERDKHERHDAGRYFLDEAAAQVAEKLGKDDLWAATFTKQMADAAISGLLTVRDPATNLPLQAGAIRAATAMVTPADVNQWLAKARPGYSWEGEVPAPGSPKRPIPVSEQHRLAILAAISDLGFNPRAIPNHGAKERCGRRDQIKSRVRGLLCERKNIMTPAVFNSAWQRLRNSGDIIDAPPS
jgi:hypothetical protein